MARENPDPEKQERTQQTGRNRCEECGNNFVSPDELSRHLQQTHPEASHQQTRERDNVPVE